MEVVITAEIGLQRTKNILQAVNHTITVRGCLRTTMLLRMKSMFASLGSENDFKPTEFIVTLINIIVLEPATLGN